MKKENYKIIIAILVTIIIVGGGMYIWQKYSEKTVQPEPAQKETPTGMIEGPLSYPSEEIPQDLKICAQNQETMEEFCTQNHIYDNKYRPSEYTVGVGYKLEVPVGDYQVYAFVPQAPDWQAYYSNYVICANSGLYENCVLHDPITITVFKNQTTPNIEPGDWYAETPE